MPEDIGLIHGVAPGSKEEYRCAKALEKYGWDFDYQVQYFGGRRVAGGQVLDFLVQTLPLPTPLQIYGDYWHGSAEAERDRLQQILLMSNFHDQLAPVVIFTEEKVDNQDVANESVLKEFGRAN